MTHRVLRALALTLAVLPLSSGQVRAADISGSEPQLNVIFHGVAGFVIWSDHVEVLFPEIHDHVYKAGAWGKELRLKQGATYELDGVRGESVAPAIARDKTFSFVNVDGIDRGPGKVFCSFRLPLPASMIGLRGARKSARQPFFSGRSTRDFSIDSLPLLHTLSYRISDLERLGFGDALAWRPEVGKDGTINLHVWSERDVDLGRDARQHPGHAFDALMSLFPSLQVKLEFSPSAKPMRRLPVRGMNTWEQWTLLERTRPLYPDPSRSSTRKGSEVSNCIGLIIDNRDRSRTASAMPAAPPAPHASSSSVAHQEPL